MSINAIHLACSHSSMNFSLMLFLPAFFADEKITTEFLTAKYTESCSKHGVEPLPKVLDQLKVRL